MSDIRVKQLKGEEDNATLNKDDITIIKDRLPTRKGYGNDKYKVWQEENVNIGGWEKKGDSCQKY